MATPNTPPAQTHTPTQAPTDSSINAHPGISERWRRHRLERKRRLIVHWLRRTANHTAEPHPIPRRRQALLHDRVAASRTELLEIAAILARTQHPEPSCLTTLQALLGNGCDSPLYNPDIHISELRATLHDICAGLRTHR